jgi:hypothetical protein
MQRIRILFLHGSNGGPNGTKARYLRNQGYEVRAPMMPYHWRYPSRWGLNLITDHRLVRGLSHSIAVAQAEESACKPDVIVASSLGGAVALNMNSNTPMVLLAPAVRVHLGGVVRTWVAKTLGREPAWARVVPTMAIRFGKSPRIPQRVRILHSLHDTWVPISSSRDLLRNSPMTDTSALDSTQGHNLGRPTFRVPERLIEVGNDHRLNDSDSLQMLDKCVRDLCSNEQ